MSIGTVSSALVASQLPQQQLQALQAIAQDQAEEQAVASTLETGELAANAAGLGQIVDVSV